MDSHRHSGNSPEAVTSAGNSTTSVGGPVDLRLRLLAIHDQLMAESDRLDRPPAVPDLYLEFIVAHMRVLLDELDEALAAAGSETLEMAA